MNERAEKLPKGGKVRLTEAAERPARLYAEWGKPDEAAKWRAKLPPPPDFVGSPKP